MKTSYTEQIIKICKKLTLIEDKCLSINNKTLSELELPSPKRNEKVLQDKDLFREIQYDIDSEQTFAEKRKKLLID